MTSYVTPKGVTYLVESSPTNSFLTFKQEGGGKLPTQLTGNFTATRFIKDAWANYLTVLDKPDMRLKENKPKEASSKA